MDATRWTATLSHMPRDLQADQAMLREVLALAQKRDFGQAGVIAREALASGFEHPLLLNVAATCLELEGRFSESLQLLQRAVALAPQDFGARNALALCLQRLDRPAEALPHLDALLRQHPDLGFLHASRGNALIALGSLGRAHEAHLRAVQLDPDNVAALASLASIATHRGNHAEARSCAEKVLSRVPNFPDAVLSLAAAELAGSGIEAAQKLLLDLLADQRISTQDRARAEGLLGDVLDAAGHYDAAFKSYSACNEKLRGLHRQFAAGTSILSYSRLLSESAARCALSRPSAQSNDSENVRLNGSMTWGSNQSRAHPARGHVFVVGFPRSGTTLLEAVLDGHPEVSSLEEHELLTEGVRRYLGAVPDLNGLMQAGEAELDTLREAYWQRAEQAGADVRNKVFIDKYPLNTLKLPLIGRLFPKARILFACRDPREVVLACFRRRFRMNAAMYELLTLPGAAALYDAVMAFAQQMRPMFGSDWQVVRYESLVSDFDAGIRAVCAFVGLDWHPGLADFATRIRSSERSTPSTAQLAGGLKAAPDSHWKHYGSQLQPVLPVLRRWVELFGYPP